MRVYFHVRAPWENRRKIPSIHFIVSDYRLSYQVVDSKHSLLAVQGKSRCLDPPLQGLERFQDRICRQHRRQMLLRVCVMKVDSQVRTRLSVIGDCIEGY